MAGRRLKVFQAHLGFYDTVVAAPSQKSALEAWGAGHNEFTKGFARLTVEPAARIAALAHPGKVLKRPFGSKGAYKLESDPVRAPKGVSRQRRVPTAARKRRDARKVEERRAAERELEEARREEARLLAELRDRRAEVARKKDALSKVGKPRFPASKGAGHHHGEVKRITAT